jgi:hypothetical protein
MDLEYVIWCLKWGSIPKNDKYGITFVLGLATQNTIGPTHQCGCMNQFEPYPFDQSHGKTVFACHHDHHHQHQHPYQQQEQYYFQCRDQDHHHHHHHHHHFHENPIKMDDLGVPP